MSETDFLEIARELELKLLDSSFRRNAAAVSLLLAEDFKEFGSSGRIYSKSEILTQLQGEPEVHISMRNFEARLLTDNIVLVTYISTRVDQGNSPVEALRSSIWAFRGSQWKMLFHQGTRLPPT